MLHLMLDQVGLDWITCHMNKQVSAFDFLKILLFFLTSDKFFCFENVFIPQLRLVNEHILNLQNLQPTCWTQSQSKSSQAEFQNSDIFVILFICKSLNNIVFQDVLYFNRFFVLIFLPSFNKSMHDRPILPSLSQVRTI